MSSNIWAKKDTCGDQTIPERLKILFYPCLILKLLWHVLTMIFILNLFFPYGHGGTTLMVVSTFAKKPHLISYVFLFDIIAQFMWRLHVSKLSGIEWSLFFLMVCHFLSKVLKLLYVNLTRKKGGGRDFSTGFWKSASIRQLEQFSNLGITEFVYNNLLFYSLPLDT